MLEPKSYPIELYLYLKSTVHALKILYLSDGLLQRAGNDLVSLLRLRESIESVHVYCQMFHKTRVKSHL